MKIRVGIFFGGKSVEHEVSVISAAQTAEAMDKDKYAIIPIYISKDNELYTGPGLFEPAHYRDLPALLAKSQRIMLFRHKGRVQLMRYPAKLLRKSVIDYLDVAFPVIHGTNGEDGSLQGFFQLHGLPYVGSDVGASASGMDKWVSKSLLQSANLPVLPGYLFPSSLYDAHPERVVRKAEEFGYPIMVKPANLGSSVGISAAYNVEELGESIELAASFSERILVEPMLVNMREINCAVMGDKAHTEASACEEPLSTGDILSFQDKYQGGSKRGAGAVAGGAGAGAVAGGAGAVAGNAGAGGAGASAGGAGASAGGAGVGAEDAGAGASAGNAGVGAEDAGAGAGGAGAVAGEVRVGAKIGTKGMGGSLRVLPAHLDKEIEAEIKTLARKAFLALHCHGVIRVDFMLDKDSEQVYINEINTIPGSLSFYLWEASGKPFRQLTDELIQLALKRKRIQDRLIWSNEVNLLSGAAYSGKGIKG